MRITKVTVLETPCIIEACKLVFSGCLFLALYLTTPEMSDPPTHPRCNIHLRWHFPPYSHVHILTMSNTFQGDLHGNQGTV